VFELLPLDLLVQDRLYDPATGWCVHRHDALPKLIFYDGAKAAFELLAVALLICVAAPASTTARLPLTRREAAFVLVCIAVILAVVGVLKFVTGVFPPFRVERYGGAHAYQTLLESLSHRGEGNRGHAFPAAHCSGAFALMSLYFVAKRPAARWLALGSGLVMGWIVGLYQMAKGAHFLSHTVATMILAWMAILVVSRAFRLPAPLVGSPVGPGDRPPSHCDVE
jgi:membrane-associated PAP2 superfamily phosphatase